MASYMGKFVWYELMTTDMKAAESFYTNVVGWSAKDSGMPGMAYSIFSAGSSMIAGLMTIPPEAKAMNVPPCWTGYIAVDDVDGYAARVKSAGGSVYRAPADIPNVGRFAIVADPQGAFFALFKPAGGQPPEPVKPGTPGHIGWHELYTKDLKTAWDFYEGLFHWTKGDAMDMGPMGTYQLFSIGNEQHGGMMVKPPQAPGPFWAYYINVDATDAAVARIKQGGGQVMNGPMEVPGGSWIAQGVDPQGAFFSIVANKR